MWTRFVTRFPSVRYLKTGLVVVLSSLIGVESFAQSDSSQRAFRAHVEMGGYGSSDAATPFWLRANQLGIVPLTSPTGTLRGGFYREYRTDTLGAVRRKFGWGAGINAVANAGSETQLLLPEAYLKLKYGRVELSAGRRRELIGLGDSTLSSGFIIQSGNALPIPKVQLATIGYVPLLFKNFVALNAGFAHGWFNAPYIKQAMLHQKYLYLRFGRPHHAVRFHLGANHQVQWGGYADYLLNLPEVAENGRLASEFRYYPFVIIGRVPKDWIGYGITANDSYAIGNHLGSYDAAFEITVKQSVFMLYHQHIYDDKSSLYFINAPDGLTGLSWKRISPAGTTRSFRVQRVTVEYLTTQDQSGSTFYVPNSRFQGGDNYFNHGQYREGWSYFGRAIGTPFMEPTPGGGFSNNRVSVGYLGAAGTVGRAIAWTARASYSHNLGTFNTPFEAARNQFSSLVSAQIQLPRLKNTALTTSLALDQGELYPAAVGGYLSLRKSW